MYIRDKEWFMDWILFWIDPFGEGCGGGNLLFGEKAHRDV